MIWVKGTHSSVHEVLALKFAKLAFKLRVLGSSHLFVGDIETVGCLSEYGDWGFRALFAIGGIELLDIGNMP